MIEFSCNRSFHSSIGMSPFEACYGFKPLFPLAAKKRAKEMINLHAKVKESIEMNNSKVSIQKNQRRKEVIFKPDYWVWVHFRKERFPQVRKGKLSPRGDGPFLMIDLQSEYNVHNVFNVSNLSPCVFTCSFGIEDESFSRRGG